MPGFRRAIDRRFWRSDPAHRRRGARLWKSGLPTLSFRCRKRFRLIELARAMFGDIAFEFASPWLEIPALKEGHDSVLPEASLPGDSKPRPLYQMLYYIWEIHVGYSEYNDMGLYETRKRQLLDCISCF